MNSRGDRFVINEVDLRDGLQIQAVLVPTEVRRRLAGLQAAAGIRRMKPARFVSPKAMLQIADVGELFPRPPQADEVKYSALAGMLSAVEEAERLTGHRLGERMLSWLKGRKQSENQADRTACAL